MTHLLPLNVFASTQNGILLRTVVSLLSSRRTRDEGLPTWKCHEEPVECIKSRGRYLDSIGSRGFGYPTPSLELVTSRSPLCLLFFFSIPISLKSGEPSASPRSWDPWSTGLDLSCASGPPVGPR